MLRVLLIALSVLCLFGRPTSLLAQGPEDYLKLEHNGCYGECPQYSVSVYADGRVSYVGKDFVRVKGMASSFVSPGTARKLFEEARKMDFFSLDDSYDMDRFQCVTDGPSEYITVSTEGRAKRIYNYCNSPQGLNDLESHIDEISGSIRWVFVDGPEMKKLLRRRFNLAKDGPKYMNEAIAWDQPDVIDALVKGGLNPNSLDTEKNTFLSNAVRDNHYKAAKILLELGGDYRIPDHWGDTPPLYAALRGPQMLRLFLAKGLDVNFGQGALLCNAATQGDVESVKRLLSLGASVNIRDANGKTPLTCAESFAADNSLNCPDTKAGIAALLQAGAVR